MGVEATIVPVEEGQKQHFVPSIAGDETQMKWPTWGSWRYNDSTHVAT